MEAENEEGNRKSENLEAQQVVEAAEKQSRSREEGGKEASNGGEGEGGEDGEGGEGKSTSTVLEVKRKTGRAKKREKRLLREPQNVTGEGPSGVHVLDYAEARANELKNMVQAMKSKGGAKRTFQLLPRHMRRRAMSHNVKRLPRRLRKTAAREMEKSGSEPTSKKSRKQRRKLRNLRQGYAQRQRKHTWLETHIWHAKRMKMVDKYGYRLAEHSNDKGVRAAYKSLMYGCLLSDISYYCCIEVEGEQGEIITSLSSLFSPETGLTIAAKAYKSGQREGRAILYHKGCYPRGAIGPVQFLWRMQAVSGSAESLILPVSKLWVWCHPATHGEVLSEVQAAVEPVNGRQDQDITVTCPPSSTVNTITGEEVTHEPCNISVRSLKDELVRFRLIGPRSHALLMETLKPSFDFQSKRTPVSSVGHTCSTMASTDQPNHLMKWWKGHCSSAIHAKLLSQCYPGIKLAPSPAEFTQGTAIGMTVLDPRLFTPSKKTDMVSAYYPQKKGQDFEMEGRLGEGQGGKFDSDGSDEDSDESGSLGDVDSNSEHSELELEAYRLIVTEQADLEQEACDVTGSGSEEMEDQEADGEVERQPVQTELPSAAILPPSLPLGVAYSPIWDASIREVVSMSRTTDQVLNTLRSKQFIKAPELKLGDNAPRVPVLLIQQSLQLQASPSPGSKDLCIQSSSSSHLGSGWDLVVPSKWAMAFWIGLIYRGARACGMRELRKCFLETLMPHFPEEFPDTPTGRHHSKTQKQLLEEKFRRYPPDKRRNYGKLLIQHPFHQPWEGLIERWSRASRLSRFLPKVVVLQDDRSIRSEGLFSQSPAKRAKLDLDNPLSLPSLGTKYQSDFLVESEQKHDALVKQELGTEFYVLRSRVAMTALKQFVYYLFKKKLESDTIGAPPLDPTALVRQAIQEFEMDDHLQRHCRALILVQFEVLQRGVVGERATISVPTSADLSSLNKSQAFSGPAEFLHPKGLTVVEDRAIYVGVSSLTRKEIKGVKQQRKVRSQEMPSQQDLRKQPVVEAFKLHSATPSRPICGYTTSVGYRLSTSKYGGIGLCSFAGLLEVVHKCCVSPGVTQLVALVRGETTQHRFVKLGLLY